MKKEDIFEAIGQMDSDFLIRSEETANCRSWKTRYIALIAAVVALMTMTVAAGASRFARPIEDAKVEHMQMEGQGYDADQNYMGSHMTAGYRIYIRVELEPDAPLELKEIYLPEADTAWHVRTSGTATGTLEGEDPVLIQVHTSWGCDTWQEDEHITYIQQSAYEREAEADGTYYVGVLPYIPDSVTVTGQVKQLAGLEVYMVSIPSVPEDWSELEKLKWEYMNGGETRLYWSDGRSFFEMQCPGWMTEAQLAQLLESMHIVEYFETVTP